jgi:DNA uptake protein ComE-like DNA-binding protein
MLSRTLRQALAFALLGVAAISSLHRGPHDFPPIPEPPTAAPVATVLDPNTATNAQLEALPGVGPTLARRIMAARPFARLDDLRRVRGIGERTLARVRDRLRIAPSAVVARGPAGS